MDLKYILNTMLICCWIWPGLVHSDRGDCLKANAKSCAECIQAGKNCGWCTLAEFLRKGESPVTRCDDIESLKMRGCPVEAIENPKGSLRVESDRNLTDLASGMKTNVEDLTQIQPQKLSLKLRSGETQSFSLHFQKAKEYPVDLYYLADLSLSVQDGLENMKKLGIELNEEMRKITSDFRIGFGVLQKNPCTAGETCRSQFSFRNVLSLNSDGATFSTLLHNQAIAASLNSSEDGADAIMQTAVCGDAIGWRNAIRLLVYYSNTGLHFSRDDKLSSMLPNDGQCHVDSQGVYTMNHHQNHPTISHLAQTLEMKKIQLLFAVKEEVKDIYQTLQDSIPKSEVGVLTSNSSNIIKLTLNAYHATDVILENSKLPEGVSIHYTAHCKNNTVHTGEDGRKCSGIQVGDEVNFAISIKAEKCPNKGQKTTINIKPWGLNEKVKIDLEFLCECECQKNATANSPYCHQGMLECGACRCKEGRIGPFCECSADEVFSEDMEASCRKYNASSICSNNGDCICGECVCKKRENPGEKFSGQYCECDNFSCDRFNGLICGGNGICHCGECVCLPTFTGNACHCSLDTEECESTNGLICNGRGTCECGRCRCTDSKFAGPTCEQCPTCPGVCTVHKNCVLCKAFNKGPKKDTCDQCEFEVSLVEHLDQLAQQHCRFRDADNSWFCFSYSINDQNVPEVRVVKNRDWC
ncbi:LOW QUALITY PROTEIN: integrin beta-1-like [Scyliorhinus canicula]|uniref:LOW QUALITY PROTEIN: integrin beta-1-like n=1 Tax=Scyliorhinus canicula TaxID=7830 RepID=UPI0018F39482|nr:LOW QUALITY PROTEIN: integrin beta-1-like [Scyliorhinus canicula]